jgi:F-type H+-transporting ATPase subunit alpha
MFTRFDGIANTRVRGTIARGERIRALIAEPRFATLPLVVQVALLSALAEGVFDDVGVAKVAGARQRIAAEPDALAPETVAAATKTGKCDEEESRTRLVEAVGSLVKADPR